MFVYVTVGPPVYIDARKFFSKTSVDRFWDACARLGAREAGPVAGVCDPSVVVPICGVVAPELLCVAMDEASLRDDSDSSCFTFLLRRREGFHRELRNGLGIAAMSRVSRSCWCSSDDGV